jgi:formamidopyrimidine-DNA glycosylase
LPELPDISAYIAALTPRVVGKTLESVRVGSPFLVRSFDPPVKAAEGQRVVGLRRLGKRIVFELEDGLFLVLHLMIAGRLHWRTGPVNVRGKTALAAFERGGLEVLDATREDFARVLRSENHTLKRALTDPRLFSGIGNAYSDEILHGARLSPAKLTSRLTEEEVDRLHAATQSVLRTWTDRFVADAARAFPEKVTAFREGMAVHGRYGKPCPVCGTPVQRIVYAENEANYCATCQTGGKLLADRALSQLLRGDWPKTLEELEERKRG